MKNVKPRDLMPWPREPEPVADIHSVFAGIKALATKGKR